MMIIPEKDESAIAERVGRKCFSPSCSCEECNLVIWANSDSVTSCGIGVWMLLIFWVVATLNWASCPKYRSLKRGYCWMFQELFVGFFFFQPAVCGFLWKVFRKFVVSRFEFIVQTLNLHWRNVCLTSFDCSGFVPCGGRMEEEAVGRQVGVRDPFCFPLAVRCFYWILHLLRLFPLGRSHANTQSWTLWAERLGFLSGSLKCTNCFALSLPLMS